MPLGQFGYLPDAFRQGRHVWFNPAVGGIDRKIEKQRVALLLQLLSPKACHPLLWSCPG